MCFCNKDLNILYIVTYFEYGISSKVIAEYVFTFLPTIRYWETKEKQYELCQTIHEIRIGTCTKSIYSNYLFIGNNIFQKFSEYDVRLLYPKCKSSSATNEKRHINMRVQLFILPLEVLYIMIQCSVA